MHETEALIAKMYSWSNIDCWGQISFEVCCFMQWPLIMRLNREHLIFDIKKKTAIQTFASNTSKLC